MTEPELEDSHHVVLQRPQLTQWNK